MLCSFLDDETRCRLLSKPGVQGSDYINANFIAVSISSFLQFLLHFCLSRLLLIFSILMHIYMTYRVTARKRLS